LREIIESQIEKELEIARHKAHEQSDILKENPVDLDLRIKRLREYFNATFKRNGKS